MIRKPLVLPELMLRIHSPNRNKIAGRISTAPGVPVDLPPEIRFVFVCFTNRCGSAYLGDILSSTGFFAQPYETLNAGNTLGYCEQQGLRSFGEYFAHIVRRDARNNTYIVKVMPEQIVLLSETGILDQIIERSEFLFMNRVDKLAQAISRAIAEQNNRWAWDSPIGLPDDKLTYSAERISQNLNDIMLLNLSFEHFFGLNGIVPITVDYERLVNAPQRELDEAALRMGLHGLKMDAGLLRYRRQANEINLAWRSRFLLETSAPPESSFGNTSMRRGERPAAPSAVTADIVAHVRNVGDVAGACGAWIGMPGSGLWIEGFSITPRQGMEVADIEYLGIKDFSQPLHWFSGGMFCGTRGLSAPLRGVGLRLRNTAVARYECAYCARFVDGTEIGPVAAGEVCHAGSLAPLETFQILINQRLDARRV
jgi:LPS sulfotransferase NodH